MGMLDGKVAIVTGGSRGIGAATARALADAGADVAISYSSSADKAEAVIADLEAKGVRAAAYRADQGDPVQARGLVQDVAREFGRLDILINNVGIAAGTPIDSEDADVRFLDRLLAVNYSGAVATIREAFPLMPEGGRIISMITSAAGRVGFPGMADYAGSKAALEVYSKGVARDLAHRGITVNVIHVGFVDTDMNPADGPAASMFLPTVAMGRYGRPEEIAAGAVFLAGPEASYITGAILPIDGGYSA